MPPVLSFTAMSKTHLLFDCNMVGHGSLIGKETGKIISVGTRIMACRVCSTRSGDLSKSKHDCRINWAGSSKAMEANLAVEMLNDTKQDSYRIGTLIRDDDSTTMAMVRNQVDHNIEKWSDINHAKKALGTRLYRLQKQERSLTTPVIKYLQKCFSYALSQNKDDPKGYLTKFYLSVIH